LRAVRERGSGPGMTWTGSRVCLENHSLTSQRHTDGAGYNPDSFIEATQAHCWHDYKLQRKNSCLNNATCNLPKLPESSVILVINKKSIAIYHNCGNLYLNNLTFFIHI
jgi:hypothetical protein